ncbi:MAG TPA: substrate-binding domain-containing protein [Tepidisphaeraceae bacterium]|nr:substrate-binding domain-containing protein [Tepidisphaeraceae bacterium]
MELERPAKYLQVSALLERRILHGDYLLKEFPTDRALSAEFQVDTRTARKAVACLIESGLLVRQSNGRPVVAGGMHRDKGLLRIAFLSVSYPSPYTWRWQRSIEQAAERRGWMLRLVTYTHMDDPIILDTLEGFDAAFMGLPGVDPSDHLIRTIRRAGRPVVFLDADVSSHGFPSLWLASPLLTTSLLEHLSDLGHRSIACLNTQPHNAVTEMRIQTWQEWTALRGMQGVLIDEPVEPSESPTERAYTAAKQAIEHGRLRDTALLCCTSPAAKGVYRAMHECGLRVGRDIAICSSDDGAGEAPYFIPSLTSMQDCDPGPYLSVCLDWFAGGGRNWKGPLLVQPGGAPMFVGESTQSSRPGTSDRGSN